jgi:hypothetical protein
MAFQSTVKSLRASYHLLGAKFRPPIAFLFRPMVSMGANRSQPRLTMHCGRVLYSAIDITHGRSLWLFLPSPPAAKPSRSKNTMVSVLIKIPDNPGSDTAR